MKFINDITHAQLLKMDSITRPNEPLRFRNLVLVFCDSGELFFELNYTSYTLKKNGFLHQRRNVGRFRESFSKVLKKV